MALKVLSEPALEELDVLCGQVGAFLCGVCIITLCIHGSCLWACLCELLFLSL